jgi:gluconolactonase
MGAHRDGTLYCADEGERIRGIIRVSPDGPIHPFVDSFEGKPLNGANDLVFDRIGILYFSDPWGSSLENPIGVALDADESAVYLAETSRNQILRYELGPDGSVGTPAVFARLTDPPGPDGMAFDAAGNLYVAHHGVGRVDVFDATGRSVDRIRVPGARVTNVAFGGPAFDELVVTECETASVYRTKLGVRGLPLFSGVGSHRAGR